jgi:hypothetical protein
LASLFSCVPTSNSVPKASLRHLSAAFRHEEAVTRIRFRTGKVSRAALE